MQAEMVALRHQLTDIKISEASVAKYMVRSPKPPSRTWRTFLDNHVSQLASIDFFTVHTVWFEILFVFLVLAHDRRRILHFNVTAHPTAEWTVQQFRRFGTADERHRFVVVIAALSCRRQRLAVDESARAEDTSSSSAGECVLRTTDQNRTSRMSGPVASSRGQFSAVSIMSTGMSPSLRELLRSIGR